MPRNSLNSLLSLALMQKEWLLQNPVLLPLHAQELPELLAVPGPHAEGVAAPEPTSTLNSSKSQVKILNTTCNCCNLLPLHIPLAQHWLPHHAQHHQVRRLRHPGVPGIRHLRQEPGILPV